MKNVYLTLMLFMLQPVFFISAQEITVENGYLVINLSALMPSGAILTNSEAIARLAEMNAQTEVTNTAYVVPGGAAASIPTGTWNARMSMKYQVMEKNLVRSGSATMNWSAAWSACKGYVGEGGVAGTWRLPTQRELEMVFVLHPQLVGKSEVAAFIGYYWCSTEDFSSLNAWIVTFNSGHVIPIAKTDAYFVRCVRDLP